MSAKEKLRGEIKNRLKNVSPEEFGIQGRVAASLLCSSSVWPPYKTVFLFLSMNSEIETLPLIKASLEDGKKVFAPRIEAEKLAFCRVLSADGPWRQGPFGTREPFGQESGGGEPVETEDFPALVIAPGIAFDRKGNRLGRGRGYYDRFFAELDSSGREYTAFGLCMDFQLVEEVPVSENDKQMDGIVTGKELYLSQDGK